VTRPFATSILRLFIVRNWRGVRRSRSCAARPAMIFELKPESMLGSEDVEAAISSSLAHCLLHLRYSGWSYLAVRLQEYTGEWWSSTRAAIGAWLAWMWEMLTTTKAFYLWKSEKDFLPNPNMCSNHLSAGLPSAWKRQGIQPGGSSAIGRAIISENESSSRSAQQRRLIRQGKGFGWRHG